MRCDGKAKLLVDMTIDWFDTLSDWHLIVATDWEPLLNDNHLSRATKQMQSTAANLICILIATVASLDRLTQIVGQRPF